MQNTSGWEQCSLSEATDDYGDGSREHVSLPWGWTVVAAETEEAICLQATASRRRTQDGLQGSCHNLFIAVSEDGNVQR